MAKEEDIKKAKRYEKEKAKAHKGKHFGGPGEPDYKRGSEKGEVKNWKSPVHSGIIEQAKKKGIREIISKSGFTKPAIELAKQYSMKLFQGNKKIV